MAEGFIGGKERGVKLVVVHCLDFALRAKETNMFHLAIEWLQAALQKAKDSNHPDAANRKRQSKFDLLQAV